MKEKPKPSARGKKPPRAKSKSAPKVKRQQLLGDQDEDRLVRSDEDEARDEEEERLRQSHPWNIMHSLERALMAVLDVAERVKKGGDDADVRILLEIVSVAIRALDAGPSARKWRKQARKWPSFVPGGNESGPLRKAWAKEFAGKKVGESNPDIPKQSRVHFEPGTPAWLAKNAFDHLEGLRRSGPQHLNPPEAVKIKPEPEYMTKARALPILSGDSVKQWLDIALSCLAAQNADWNWWLRFLPGREQTVRTKVAHGAGKSMKHGISLPGEVDAGTAKSTVKLALLEGFRALATLR